MVTCKDEMYVETREEHAENLDLDMHSGYNDLANAIIAQAYKDLVYALLIGNADGQARASSCKSGTEGYKSLMKWFRSDPWYKTLTNVDGEWLIRKAKIEVKNVEKCVEAADPIFAFNEYRNNGLMSFTLTDFKSYLDNYRFDKARPFYQKKLNQEKVTKTKKFENLAQAYFDNVLWSKTLYQKDFFAAEKDNLEKLSSRYDKLSVTKLKSLIKIRAKIIEHDSVR